MSPSTRHRLLYGLIPLIVIALDQWSKWLIRTNFRIHWDTLTIIPGFFDIVHVRNKGAAFGLGNSAGPSVVPTLLNILAVAVFIFVLVLAMKSQTTDRILQVGLHLILGGAVGNLIDRFTLGSVVDFLDVYITIGGVERHWPAFNIADSAICVGIGLLLLDMWKKPAESGERTKAAA